MVRKKISTSIILTSLFLLFISSFLIGSGAFNNLRTGIISSLVLGFHLFIFFMIFHSGNINKWRKIFFTSYGVAFVIAFVWWTMGDRGHMWLLDSEVLYAEAPMCHIVVPMLILPVIFTKTIIFPTAFSQASFMIFMVIIISVIFGRAFCAWGCFFGGQDELFASIPGKKRWKIGNIHPFIRYFSFAFLAFIIIHSFTTMSPTYCWWFCPFKTTSEFIEINSFIRVIQTFIFVSLWAILVILLPILSKKRIQCGLFCPMGAFLSCTNKINLFRIKIDLNKCNNCNSCTQTCPNFSITKESLTSGKTLMTCTKCGECIEKCPKDAISYSIPGVKQNYSNIKVPHQSEGTESVMNEAPASLNKNRSAGFWKTLYHELWDPAVIFVFGIFTVSVIMSTSYFSRSISRIINYFFGI